MSEESTTQTEADPNERRALEPGDPRSLKDGRYTCVSVLGEGSMGRTFLADDAQTGTRLAIKALYPSRLADWKDLELFQRESAVLQRIDHDLVPRYIDSFHEGEGDGVCYFLAQTWVDGETLRDVLRTGKRFEESEIITLGRDLLGVLTYLHGLEPTVVHRDIKPENVILRRSDGKPTLVDFGAVREVVRLTMGGGSTIVGSYGYMSPEQLMGRAIPATDIYALGITLLECLTRKVPQDMHGNEAKALIAQLSSSDGLKRVLGRMCAPMLADRYRTAAEVLEDLNGIASGQLFHVKRIESDIAQREKEREKALKKASSPGVHFIYVFLVFALGIALISVVYFLVQALVVGFETTFLIAALTGGAGLMITIAMVATRYVHDAWEAPKPDWLTAKATIKQVRQNYSHEQKRMITEIVYSFPIRTGNFEYTREVSESFKVGQEFQVWYPPSQPQLHEAQDIRKPDTSAMLRLFSQKVEHTPE
ncbi:MAG: serine/threonine-protein kinase [bacterium]